MVIKKIIEKIKPKEESEEEVEIPSEEKKPEEICLKIEKINEFSDTEKVLNLLRENYIVIVSIKDLRQKDLNELKRCVNRIKKTVEAVGGEIIGIGEDFILVAPSFVKIVI